MNERQERIYGILNKRGSASIEQLCGEVFASPATIRRDLNAMEQEGLLVRTWGGAISSNQVNNDPPLFIRSNTNTHAKRAIAKTAAGFLHDNASVFLPSGTTVTEVAKQMHRYKNLTVFTNGLDIIGALNNHLSAKIIVLGGELYENYDMIGSLADSAIDSLNADLFFFSCSGISAEGFTSSDMVRLDIIKKMKKNSAKTILLADTSKVGKKYTYRGFDFAYVDHVVMERRPDDIALVKALGKKLVTAEV